MGCAGGLERSPELSPDHAFTQPPDVRGRAFVNTVQIVRDDIASRRPVDLDDPRKVVVPIDQRRAPQYIPCDCERIVPGHGPVRHCADPQVQSTGTATKRTSPSPLETSSSAGFFASAFAPSIALAMSLGCSTAW